MRQRPGSSGGVVAAFAALAALVLGGCAQNLVQVRQSSVRPGNTLALSRVAVAPFRAAPRSGAGDLAGGAALVASYVADAFAARGIDVVPPSDVGPVVEKTLSEGGGHPVAETVGSRFGAGALVTGTVYRFQNRSGESLGSLSPASVGFEVKLYSTADGHLLWSGVFDHTQVALGENALTAAQYPGGGTRWLTVGELARWGAGRLVKAIPLAQAQASSSP
jgi:hypothetical protein